MDGLSYHSSIGSLFSMKISVERRLEWINPLSFGVCKSLSELWYNLMRAATLITWQCWPHTRKYITRYITLLFWYLVPCLTPISLCLSPYLPSTCHETRNCWTYSSLYCLLPVAARVQCIDETTNALSFGLSANQPAVLFSHTKSAPATSYQLPASQQYCSLITNQHQPPATAKRTQRKSLAQL